MTPTPITPSASSNIPPTVSRITNTRLLQIARILWWALVALAAFVFVYTLPMLWSSYNTLPSRPGVTDADNLQRIAAALDQGLAQLGLSRSVYAAYKLVLQLLILVTFDGIAFLVFRSRFNERIGMCLAFCSVSFGTLLSLSLGVFPEGGFYGIPALDTLGNISITILGMIGVATLWLFLSAFPDGRFVPRWSFIFPLVGVLLAPFSFLPDTHSPLRQANWPLLAQFILAVFIFGGPFVSQVYRYFRVSTPIQRQQTKWFLFAFMVVFAVTMVGYLLDIIFPSQDLNGVPTFLSDFFITIGSASGILLPIAIGMSILHYRLWDIDLVINRSLVYGVVTALLVLLFVSVIALVSALTEGHGSAWGAILATGAAGLLFNPARKQVQRFVDRHVYHFNFDLNQLAAAQKLPEITHPGALSGRKLGQYDVLDVIGKGGMGEVYKGQSNGQTVALKILPDDLAQQDQFRQRFVREAQTLTALNHPNIVKMIGSGDSEGIAYLAMEYIEGEELAKRLKANGALSLDDTRDILIGLASALDYAHEQGFVHRDIKPSNVMLRRSRDGETWEGVLMDFGVAKIREAQTGLTGTGAIGTIDYMAPEQIMSAKEVDGRADVYALGVMAYEMLTGERPFKGSAAQIMFAHIQQPAPDPRDVKDNLPSSAAYAIKRALAKKPEERFATAGEFAAALG
jgi:protein kinase-like protein